MSFLTKLLPAATLGAALSAALPAMAVVRAEAPTAGLSAILADDDRYDRRQHRRHHGHWRGPPPGYGYYAPPPRAYYAPPQVYYPPPRAYFPPPQAYYPPPPPGVYFRF